MSHLIQMMINPMTVMRWDAIIHDEDTRYIILSYTPIRAARVRVKHISQKYQK